MISLEQMASILDTLPDPAFVLSRSGRYVAVFGGRDIRYYHDGSGLIGQYIGDLIYPEKANWILAQINRALDERKLLIEEYELSNRDVIGLPDDGPQAPIWFEGRIQALNFQVDGEDVVLWVASNISARHELEVRLRELCDTDQLTGLYNRRRLETDLGRQYEVMLRYGQDTSVLLFDLDNLKQINDTWGHHAGDEMIQAAAEACRQTLRRTDVASRFGGDEFAIVLPSTSHEQAVLLAQRLQEVLRGALSGYQVGSARVSASVGVATLRADDASFEQVLRRADEALYRAKRQGKDQVVSA